MNLPGHVAIIMDGNGRWAEKRGLPRLAGHQAGVNRIRTAVKTFLSYNVPYLTLYGFSSENWNRPEEEVQGLFQILEDQIDREAAVIHRQGVRMQHLGRLNELPRGVREAIQRACELTRDNTNMHLNFAFNYGGRTEIIDAAKALIAEGVVPDLVDEKLFEEHLYTAGMPGVDLVIRTCGELRLSNFLIWQAAYAEYYFSKILWPDFTASYLEKALSAFDRRHRRFGAL
jgi:undecaprenyl diphosphate synthase